MKRKKKSTKKKVEKEKIQEKMITKNFFSMFSLPKKIFSQRKQ